MSKQRTYTGRSGQMAVMAELLFRQCNVAIPEVDWGTDVFAFLDDREEVARVQVKASQGERYKQEEGYSVQFDIPIKQLISPDTPPLYYALAARLGDQWMDFLVISRSELSDYCYGQRRFGTENKASGNWVLTVQVRPTSVLCGEVDLAAYRNAWVRLPPVRLLSDLALTTAEQRLAADQAVMEQAGDVPPSSSAAKQPPQP
jgi:hypothetical protein